MHAVGVMRKKSSLGVSERTCSSVVWWTNNRFDRTFPEMGCRSPQSIGGTPVTIHVYVEDVDAAFNKAVAAGAQVRMPLKDMFWGDRYAELADPFGHDWSLATHKEDLTPEEISKRAQAAFSECAEPVTIKNPEHRN